MGQCLHKMCFCMHYKKYEFFNSKEGGVDPASHGAQQEDRFYNNKAFQTPDVDQNDPSQQDAALKIQTKYRQFHAKQKVEDKRQERAAVKIQAGYRGWEDRKKVKDLRDAQTEESPAQAPAAADAPGEEIDIDLDDPEVAAAATKIQAGFKGLKARKEVQKLKEETTKVAETEAKRAVEEEEVDIDLNDPDVQSAAVKIQAGFKGFKARKEAKTVKGGDKPSGADTEAIVEKAETPKEEEEEEVDIDLEDPEVAKAAEKIQAGFRGLQGRKKVKTMREEANTAPSPPPPPPPETANGQQGEEVDIDLNDPEVQKAAVTIQAGFKGLKTRKELKEKQGAAGDTTASPPGGGQQNGAE